MSKTRQEEAAEAAALMLADAGKAASADPVRMYMREMGSVELLSRAGELAITKRIEEGFNQAARELVRFGASMDCFIQAIDRLESGDAALSDFIAGLVNPIRRLLRRLPSSCRPTKNPIPRLPTAVRI